MAIVLALHVLSAPHVALGLAAFLVFVFVRVDQLIALTFIGGFARRFLLFELRRAVLVLQATLSDSKLIKKIFQ